MTEEYNSRTADKFVVRLKPGQRDSLKARAQADNQSMNDAALTAIEKHLQQGAAFDELLRIVEKAIAPQAGAFVQIRRDYLRTLVKACKCDLPESDPAIVAAIALLGEDAHEQQS